MQIDWKTTTGKDAKANWKDTHGPSYKSETNEKGQEFVDYNNLVLTNHRNQYDIQKMDLDEQHHNETDNKNNNSKEVL